jgi:ECF sigma factor
MRQILVDFARSHGYQKRGGGAQHVALDDAMMIGQPRDEDLVALDEALTALAGVDERKARVVELRFFGGLTEAEMSETLKVSPETVRRDWRLAKSWLLLKLISTCPAMTSSVCQNCQRGHTSVIDSSFNFALRHSVTKAIQRRAIQPSATEAVVLVYVLGTDLKIVLPSIFLNGGDLRSDVFVELLFGAGDSRVKGCALHHFPQGLLGEAVNGNMAYALLINPNSI